VTSIASCHVFVSVCVFATGSYTKGTLWESACSASIGDIIDDLVRYDVTLVTVTIFRVFKAGLLTRPWAHEAKADAEARKSEAEVETEATESEAEAEAEASHHEAEAKAEATN